MNRLLAERFGQKLNQLRWLRLRIKMRLRTILIGTGIVVFIGGAFAVGLLSSGPSGGASASLSAGVTTGSSKGRGDYVDAWRRSTLVVSEDRRVRRFVDPGVCGGGKAESSVRAVTTRTLEMTGRADTSVRRRTKMARQPRDIRAVGLPDSLARTVL